MSSFRENHAAASFTVKSGLYNSREPNLSGQQIYSHPLEYTPDSKPMYLQIQSNKLKLITQLNLFQFEKQPVSKKTLVAVKFIHETQ